jgi:hypothetical protein
MPQPEDGPVSIAQANVIIIVIDPLRYFGPPVSNCFPKPCAGRFATF